MSWLIKKRTSLIEHSSYPLINVLHMHGQCPNFGDGIHGGLGNVSAPAENDTQQALSGLFGSWFLQLISWLMLFCCISERKILYHDWVALQSVTQHCRWGFDRTIQGQCHKQKCSSHPDRLGFRVKGRWNAMDSWIREKLQCKHTISNFDVIHDHKRWFSWEPCPMCFNKEMLQV